jgi:hypothetical protein
VTEEQWTSVGRDALRPREPSQVRARFWSQGIGCAGAGEIAQLIGKQPAVVIACNGHYAVTLEQLATAVDISPAVCNISDAEDAIQLLIGKMVERYCEKAVFGMDVADDTEAFHDLLETITTIMSGYAQY